MVMSFWSEDEGGQFPNQDDLVRWADQYGLTVPVASYIGNLASEFYGSTPMFVLLKPGMEVVSTRNTVNRSELESALGL